LTILRLRPWLSTTKTGLNGFQQLEFQISELAKNFKICYLYFFIKTNLFIIWLKIILQMN
jgi:hypothetical protein